MLQNDACSTIVTCKNTLKTNNACVASMHTGKFPFLTQCPHWQVRVWMPPCPHASDPSRCNPYAFIYPRLANGTVVPAARHADGTHIPDSMVTMAHVASPVKVSHSMRGTVLYSHTVLVWHSFFKKDSVVQVLLAMRLKTKRTANRLAPYAILARAG